MGMVLTKEPLPIISTYHRQAGREALVICICFFCALLLHCLHIDVCNGIVPESISALPFIGHDGFVCPLCGGTRAFVLFSFGKLTDALHCSLLGTALAAWLLFTLPIRFIVYVNSGREWSKALYRLIKRMEHPDLLIITMALTMLVQLWMHYSLGFRWIPLQQLSGK